MKHFLDIKSLAGSDIEQLLQTANLFKEKGVLPDASAHTVAQLFYENSTRTRVSFEMAAKNMGMRVVNVDLNYSSTKKGESIEDTILNLWAMGIRYFVLRHPQEHLPQKLAQKLASCRDLHIINAGDGKHAHPSQAMLDLMTIRQYKPDLANTRIVLVGNLRHSRVANSLQQVLKKAGAGEFLMVAPPLWQPESVHFGRVTDNLTDALRGADVVMGLRIQHERLAVEDKLDIASYQQDYALTAEKLKLAKSDAILMHPGPVNRGVEMESAIVDSPQSKILEQVRNGVWMRMAVLARLVAC